LGRGLCSLVGVPFDKLRAGCKGQGTRVRGYGGKKRLRDGGLKRKEKRQKAKDKSESRANILSQRISCPFVPESLSLSVSESNHQTIEPPNHQTFNPPTRHTVFYSLLLKTIHFLKNGSSNLYSVSSFISIPLAVRR
jgi:hypothetical protein